jgi:hypothetical protein
MTDRYRLYEELRERGLALRLDGDTAAGDALLELARLVLVGLEKDAAAVLRQVPAIKDVGDWHRWRT